MQSAFSRIFFRIFSDFWAHFSAFFSMSTFSPHFFSMKAVVIFFVFEVICRTNMPFCFSPALFRPPGLFLPGLPGVRGLQQRWRQAILYCISSLYALWSWIPLPFPSNKAHLGWEWEGSLPGFKIPPSGQWILGPGRSFFCVRMFSVLFGVLSWPLYPFLGHSCPLFATLALLWPLLPFLGHFLPCSGPLLPFLGHSCL